MLSIVTSLSFTSLYGLTLRWLVRVLTVRHLTSLVGRCRCGKRARYVVFLYFMLTYTIMKNASLLSVKCKRCLVVFSILHGQLVSWRHHFWAMTYHYDVTIDRYYKKGPPRFGLNWIVIACAIKCLDLLHSVLLFHIIFVQSKLAKNLILFWLDDLEAIMWFLDVSFFNECHVFDLIPNLHIWSRLWIVLLSLKKWKFSIQGLFFEKNRLFCR